jgi:hypothetical protein
MDIAAGTMLYWKGYQECQGDGKTLAWAEEPMKSKPNPDHPAAVLEVIAKSRNEHSHGGSTKSSPSASIGGYSGHSASAMIDANSNAVPANHMMRPYHFSESTGFFISFKQAPVTITGGFVGVPFATLDFGKLVTDASEMCKRFEHIAIVAKRGNNGRLMPAIVIGGLAHGLRLLLHYSAMLIVMTMIIWIIIVIVLGHDIGFIAFTAFGDKLPFGKEDAVATGKGLTNQFSSDNSAGYEY